MKEYNYELFNKRNGGFEFGAYAISCRVYNLNEIQIEVFDFLVDRYGKYHAWTGDIVTPKPWRKEIEEALNN